MQLTRKQRRRMRRTLLASTCALLGTTPAMADSGDWSFDTGVLFYSEVDRVKAIEPAALIKRDLGDDSYVSARIVTDTLSGATPTGAMPGSQSVTVTGPSGSASTTTAPGATPLDPNFKDFRKAISVTWSQPLAQLWRLDLGGAYSIEHDFKSEGVNALLSRDFNERNTTLSLGLSDEWDLIFPIGGIHAPLSTVAQTTTVEPPSGDGSESPEGPGLDSLLRAESEGGGEGGGGSTNPSIAANRTKQVHDVLFGLTQVMNRDWITVLNFSYSRSEGYQNDPYKMVSILNTHLGGAGQLPIIGGPSIGEPISNIYENRPDLHTKRAVYWGNKAYLGGSVVDFSYRYGWDDWGIHSNTFELRYRIPFGDGFYVMPHLRYYHQSAADFYQRALLDTDVVPQFVSADYRLAEFNARTVGIEVGGQTSGGTHVSVRFERYIQSGRADPRVQIGIQQGYDQFPELQANIVQVSLSF